MTIDERRVKVYCMSKLVHFRFLLFSSHSMQSLITDIERTSAQYVEEVQQLRESQNKELLERGWEI